MSNAEARGEIEATNRRLAEATKRKDAIGMASLYADNATFIGPDGKPVAGKGAIEAMWKAQIGAGLSDIELETLSVEELAPGMYAEIGKYVAVVTPAGGQRVEDKGRYMVVWKRNAEGRLQLYVDLPASASQGA